MGGGLDSRCVGRVYGADGAVHGNQPDLTIQTTEYPIYRSDQTKQKMERQ